MYSKEFQDQLYKRYVTHTLREHLQQNFNFRQFKSSIANKIDYASVAYIDIFGFSNRIKDYTTEQVCNYLAVYYSKVLPIIKRFDGQIDKIMGDGIIVVFSKIFNEIENNKLADASCLYCCQDCIEELKDSEFEVKAAIGSGNLFFCKTGVEQIYEEYSCIGHPLTIAYRLESIADRNQILLMEDTSLSHFIYDYVDLSEHWEEDFIPVELKGIEPNVAHILKYN